jgi:gliding motility-associated-like protein
MVDNPGKTGPFEYRLYHTTDMNSWPVNHLEKKVLGDTTYIHERIDTKTVFPHYYKVELWDTGDGTIIDEDFEIASTLYPILQPSDKAIVITFGRLTPWVNAGYEIYRCTKNGSDICVATEWVGRTDRETYTDTGLKNGQEYCYRIESKGYRKIDGIEYENTNWSHVACIAPVDNVPPCAPELKGESICEENRNLLEWTYVDECMYDVEMFQIYYSFDGRQYNRIGSVNRDEVNPYTTLQYSYSDYQSLVGLYYVTAVDSAGNESPWSYIVALDECGEYDLPNVFTPNGDGINDVFKSFNPGGVQRVDMKIYNRGGKLVYKTEDPDINWDGRDIDSKRFVATGVYYYICTVYEERLTGFKTIPLSGFVHVYYGEGAQPYKPPEN